MRLIAETERLSLKSELEVKLDILTRERDALIEERKMMK